MGLSAEDHKNQKNEILLPGAKYCFQRVHAKVSEGVIAEAGRSTHLWESVTWEPVGMMGVRLVRISGSTVHLFLPKINLCFLLKGASFAVWR